MDECSETGPSALIYLSYCLSDCVQEEADNLPKDEEILERLGEKYSVRTHGNGRECC
jgi:hypothetical protein